MATYDECLSAMEHPGLFNKIRIAVLVAADTVRLENVATANHVARLAWAKRVMDSPDTEARKMLGMAVVQNRAAALAAITGATDAAVQTAVNNAIDVLAQ